LAGEDVVGVTRLTKTCGVQGFIAEHRDIELLKLRNFTVSKKFPDAFLTDADGQAKLAEVIGAMVGFVRGPCPRRQELMKAKIS
jgi:uncharacterized protein DUF2461